MRRGAGRCIPRSSMTMPNPSERNMCHRLPPQESKVVMTDFRQ
jgi:hypothetical protein